MPSKPIIFAEQDQITEFDAIATPFFKDVLGLNYNECFVSDESTLSDFSSCGLPAHLDNPQATLTELYDTWDAWIIAEIKTRYQVTIDCTTIYMVDLLNRIAEAKNPPLH